MNKKILRAAMTLSVLMVAHAADAMELWDPATRGITIGTPAGMLPPKGVYFLDDNFYGKTSHYNEGGQKLGKSTLYSYVNAPIMVWVPGIRVLDATYAVGIAQPFDYTSSDQFYGRGTVSGGGPAPGAGNMGFSNTIISPVILSWNLMPLFISTGLSVYLPTATNTLIDLYKGKFEDGGSPSGNSGWIVQPRLGLTYLFRDGWSASANILLAFPVSTTKGYIGPNGYGGAAAEGTYRYHSGDILMCDYTIGKTLGEHWSVGVGGATQNQISNDTASGTSILAKTHGRNANDSLAQYVGYQFQGGLLVQGILMEGLGAKNDAGGDYNFTGGYGFNLRFSLPL